MPQTVFNQVAIVAEATIDTSIVEIAPDSVTVEVPNIAPVVQLNGGAGTLGVLTVGPGLTGGGSMATNIAVNLSSSSLVSLARADTAVQPGTNVSRLVNDAGFVTLADLTGLFQPVGAGSVPFFDCGLITDTPTSVFDGGTLA